MGDKGSARNKGQEDVPTNGIVANEEHATGGVETEHGSVASIGPMATRDGDTQGPVRTIGNVHERDVWKNGVKSDGIGKLDVIIPSDLTVGGKVWNVRDGREEG